MKKLFYGMATLALLFHSCESETNPGLEQEAQIDMSDFYVYTDADVDETAKSNDNSKLANSRSCYTMANLNQMLKDDPDLERKMYDIEFHSRKYIAGKSNLAGKGKPGGGTGGEADVDVTIVPDNFGTINIPVNVIVVYPNASVITDAQIQSQINVLNNDFKNKNTNLLPSGTNFVNDATDAGIQFTWNGIAERHNDPKLSWGTNNSVKSAYPPSSTSTHLNIWVCNIGGGILGYAQFPGGNSATDGIVVDGNYFGLTSNSAYGSGRTATHEIGHYLNLRHIWGDGGCRQDDFVVDTPSSDRYNAGCPSFPTIHCNTADMTMNYMDYTYDQCMYMFTDGQRNRMRSIFASGGPRAAMIGN